MRRLVLGAVIVIVVGLVVYPVVMVITASFSPRESLGIATVAQKWYSGYAAVRANLRPILNSVVIATGSTLLALVFGTGLAWITARTNVPFRRVIGISILLPFMISPLVLAIGWMILTGPKGSGVLNSVLTGIPGLGWVSINVASPLGIIWVLGLFFTAISYLMMSAAFQNMEPALEESSRVLGASTGRTAFRITLPLMRPALAGTSVLLFILGLGQFGVPAVLGMGRGFPVAATDIYVAINQNVPDIRRAAAMGVVLFLVSVVGVWLQYRVIGKASYTTVSARGFRAQRVDVKRLKWPLMMLSSLYVILAGLLPIGALVWTSLTRFITSSFSAAKYTVGNYSFILGEYSLTITALRNTLILATLAATVVVTLTVTIAWIVNRNSGFLPRFLSSVSMAPVAIPAVVLSVGLLWAWTSVTIVPIWGTLWVLGIAFVTMYIPFGLTATSPAVAQIDPALEECSFVCGAKWLRTFRSILLPLLRPAILSAWTLVVILVVNEVAAGAILSNSKTLPLGPLIFDTLNNGTIVTVAALSVVQIVFILTLLGASGLLRRKWASPKGPRSPVAKSA